MVYGYIYKIKNLVNDKVYIGQTTQPPKNRWNSHLSLLNRNKHDNPHLQHSFNKYGKDNFKFLVLNYATTKEVLDKLEDDYIIQYNCLHRKHGYNLLSGGSRGKHSEESKLKMSKSRKGEDNSRWNHDIDNNYIKDLRLKGYSIPIIAQKVNMSNTGVHQRLQLIFGKNIPKSTIRTISDTGGINRIYIDIKDIEYQIRKKNTLKESARNLGVGRTTIPEILKRDYNTTWSELFKKIHGRDPKGVFKKGNKRRRGLFGFIGVRFSKGCNPEMRPWFSIIRYGGHNKYLGHFPDPVSAQVFRNFVYGILYGGM